MMNAVHLGHDEKMNGPVPNIAATPWSAKALGFCFVTNPDV